MFFLLCDLTERKKSKETFQHVVCLRDVDLPQRAPETGFKTLKHPNPPPANCPSVTLMRLLYRLYQFRRFAKEVLDFDLHNRY